MRKLGLIGVALIGISMLGGCASGPAGNPVSINTELLSYPELRQETTGNLGDTLLSISERRTTLGVEVTKPVQVDFMGGVTVLPQKVKASYENDRGIPIRTYPVATNPPPPVYASIVYDEAKAEFCIFEGAWGRTHCSIELTNAIEIGQIEEEDPLVFQRELVYNGRVGNELKFIYREFDSLRARTAFTQEVQYDLEESNIIGFKDARMRVIEANNRVVTYEVLSNFDPRAR